MMSWERSIVLEDYEKILNSWEGDYEAHNKHRYRGATHVSIETTNGVVVLTNKRIIFLQKKGVFSPSYTMTCFMVLKYLQTVSFGGTMNKHIDLVDLRGEYVFHLHGVMNEDLERLRQTLMDLAAQGRGRTQMAKGTLSDRVKDSIRCFEPSGVYEYELPYHTELQGWLKHEFSQSVIEKQVGASRPDIVIENIAVEIKGPTDDEALNTLATKCLKYSQHYENLILVLFEPRFSEGNYQEIVRGINQHFPNVEIIRKDWQLRQSVHAPSSSPERHTFQQPFNIDQIRQEHPRAYETWTRSEDEALTKRYSEGMSVQQMAQEHQRETGAIRARLKKLGLVKD